MIEEKKIINDLTGNQIPDQAQIETKTRTGYWWLQHAPSKSVKEEYNPKKEVWNFTEDYDRFLQCANTHLRCPKGHIYSSSGYGCPECREELRLEVLRKTPRAALKDLRCISWQGEIWYGDIKGLFLDLYIKPADIGGGWELKLSKHPGTEEEYKGAISNYFATTELPIFATYDKSPSYDLVKNLKELYEPFNDKADLPSPTLRLLVDALNVQLAKEYKVPETEDRWVNSEDITDAFLKWLPFTEFNRFLATEMLNVLFLNEKKETNTDGTVR